MINKSTQPLKKNNICRHKKNKKNIEYAYEEQEPDYLVLLH